MLQNFHKNNLLIIDGHSCLYKSYYALINLKNKNKYPTGAIYGFINTLNYLNNILNPRKTIIVFDTKYKTNRTLLYKKYKNHRKPMPKNLYIQIKPLKKILLAIGFPIITLKNIEADDIIGTLTQIFKKKFSKIFIYSSDKDMFQLINNNVHLIQNIKNLKILSNLEVFKKFKLPAKKLVDFFSLTGDTVDNIPGVPGIGPKTALFLLKNFSSLKKIYKNLKNIEKNIEPKFQRILKILKKNKKNAFLSKKLIKINKNINLKINLKKIFQINPNIPFLIKIFTKYQFYKYLKNIHNQEFSLLKKN